MKKFEVPHQIVRIMKTIETAGFETFLVGGCVRDLFLNRAPSDWDIASSAPPQEIMRIFEKTVPTGVKYGTVTVICGDCKAEVTTFRSESGYGDYRRPSSVLFCGDIMTDLSRRDFTVNAMAFNLSHGLVDPFDGRRDIKKRLIRAVGDPDLRFEEDALRILRAYRFAAQLDFEVEPITVDAMRKKAALVAQISGERVKGELNRIIMSERPQLLFTLIRDGSLDYLEIAVNNTAEEADEYHRLALTPKALAARWAAFFYIIQSVDKAGALDASIIMKKLRFDTLTRAETLHFLYELLSEQIPDTAAKIKKRLSTGFLPKQYEVYLYLIAAITGCDVTGQLSELHRIEAQSEPYALRMLQVNGKDILNLGVAPGPACGKILEELLNKVIDDPTLNDKKTLIYLAKQALHVH